MFPCEEEKNCCCQCIVSHSRGRPDKINARKKLKINFFLSLIVSEMFKVNSDQSKLNSLKIVFKPKVAILTTSKVLNTVDF